MSERQSKNQTYRKNKERTKQKQSMNDGNNEKERNKATKK